MQEDGYEKDMTEGSKPTRVPEKAKPVGEIQDRWLWVEPSVWTTRMLTALEQGLKGGVWFSLMDKVASKRNLRAATKKVAANKGSAGVDHVTIKRFLEKAPEEIDRLYESLCEGVYQPQAIRRVYIPKVGSKEKRPLGIPTVRDRVVQASLRNVIEPIFEREFAEHSYGFRPERGCKDALRRVAKLLKEGHTWIIDADLKSYFDTIPRDRLMTLLRKRIADGRVLELIESFLNQSVLEGLKYWIPEDGTPQGAVISPLLANIYLNPLDHLMAELGYEMVRYADDFAVLCRSETEAKEALETIRNWTTEVGLTLHPTKTCIVDIDQPGGIDFLGYHFERGIRNPNKINRWPRKKSLQKFKDSIRNRTRRANGHSMLCIIASLNPVLRGWFQYFKHSSVYGLRDLDGWIRSRLRSILRVRQKNRKGKARGNDHQRWPNKFFSARGLFSLAEAHVAARQSSQR